MRPTTEILFARHGEARCNLMGIAGGERGCTGLTDRGSQQALALAARLAADHVRRPIGVLYASPRRRAIETAQAVAGALGLPIQILPGLRNPDQGLADSQRWATVLGDLAGTAALPIDYRPAPGAETWIEYIHRATSTLADLAKQHRGQRVLLIAHAQTVDAAHALFLELPATLRPKAGFVTDHASLTIWRGHHPPGHWKLVCHCHNAAPQPTG